jgi:hypothetical protein
MDQNVKSVAPKTPDPWDVMQGIQQALAALASRPTGGTDPALVETLSKAMERLAVVQEQGAERIATETKRAARPSNEVVHERSVYNPRGRDYPVHLRCKMDIPWEADENTLTREEIQLLNLVQQGEYRVRRTDGSMYVEQIKLTTNLSGKPNLITMTNETAFNNDNYKTAPPLVDRLRQILKQHSKAVNAEAAAVLSMDEEEALIAAGELAVTA